MVIPNQEMKISEFDKLQNQIHLLQLNSGLSNFLSKSRYFRKLELMLEFTYHPFQFFFSFSSSVHPGFHVSVCLFKKTRQGYGSLGYLPVLSEIMKRKTI